MRTSRTTRSNGETPGSAAEWLKQAESFLSPKDVAELRRKLADGVKARLVRTIEEAKRLKAELETIDRDDDSQSTEHDADEAESPLDDENPGPEMSVRKLVLHFGARHKGKKAHDFIKFVHEHRPDVDPKAVHAELYRASKPDGPQWLRKTGSKPNMLYFPNKISASHRRGIV